MRKKKNTGIILGLAVLALAAVAVLTYSGGTVYASSIVPVDRILGLFK